MPENHYTTNRQLLLHMVQELHQRGFEKLRIEPSLSPSGMHWRCTFYGAERKHQTTASNWIYDIEDKSPGKKIRHTPASLADLFEQEHAEFMPHCQGPDAAYAQWYRSMLQRLHPTELPYAYSDYEATKGYWHTTERNLIKTQEDDE